MSNSLFFNEYPNLKDCSIQTFDDIWKNKSLARIAPRTEGNLELMEDINSNGAGVFFSVNSMERGKRSISSVTGVNARICEMDDYTKEEQKQKIHDCPIRPSMVVESKKSYHMYRFSEDGTVEKRKEICKGLRDYFDWDPAVVDISRVLRVPGYYHLKDRDDPYMIECVYFDGKKRTEQEMLNAYPYTPPIPKIVKARKIEGNDFREVVNQWSASGMLQRLSSTSLVNGESITFEQNTNGTQQILIDGKATWCWIDTGDKIGSNDEWGPSRVNWVIWYGNIDYKGLSKWIEDNCSDLLPAKLNGIVRPPSLKKIYTSLGYKYPKGPFNDKRWGFKSGELIMISSGSNQGKTTYVLEILKANQKLGKKVGIINMEFDLIDTFHNEFFRAKGYDNNQLKLIGTDLMPISEETQKRLNKYIEKRKEEVPIVDLSQNSSFDMIVDKVKQMWNEGYSLIAVDSLSSIGDTASELRSQIEIIQKLRDFCTETGMVIILIHHFNKWGKEYSGSAKLRDLCNITIEIRPATDKNGEKYRIFELSKDKAHIEVIQCHCYLDWWEYLEVQSYLQADAE